MNIIKTKSFELATIERGDKNASKLVIVLPGRLDTKDYVCFSNHLEFLASKGFYGISFDPPGTWDSPGGTELFTTTNYMKAVNELIEYFGNRQTILMGHSRGGAVAILAGASNQYVKGIVAIMSSYGSASPPKESAIAAGFDTSYRDFPPGTSKTKEQKKFILPLSYFKDAEHYNNKAVLKTSMKPKLLFYGSSDEFTKPQQFIEIYSQTSEPKMSHELHTNHDYRYYPEAIEEVNKVVDIFISKFGL